MNLDQRIDEALDSFGRTTRVIVVNGLSLDRYEKNKEKAEQTLKQLISEVVDYCTTDVEGIHDHRDIESKKAELGL